MNRIKAERLRKGLTQGDLAYYSRVAASEISKFERGWARPYPNQARRLAEVLEIRPEELLEKVSADELYALQGGTVEANRRERCWEH